MLTCTSFSGRSPRVLNACTAWSLSRVKAFSTTSWSHSVRSVSCSLAATWGGGDVGLGLCWKSLKAVVPAFRAPPRSREQARE